MHSELMTVGSLIEALRGLPASAWVCTEAGPVDGVKQELGANEPFVVLSVRVAEPSGDYLLTP